MFLSSCRSTALSKRVLTGCFVIVTCYTIVIARELLLIPILTTILLHCFEWLTQK